MSPPPGGAGPVVSRARTGLVGSHRVPPSRAVARGRSGGATRAVRRISPLIPFSYFSGYSVPDSSRCPRQPGNETAPVRCQDADNDRKPPAPDRKPAEFRLPRRRE
ncbi:hypothetical protein Kpho01_04630 [Kitasatospora phosalacinea]|uniref:Uncharacterized protein n=1 Tax=Kitasatospora phosalacinea TaxID=2065 RepID=A0A9W6ULR8_9ACTN|nr:hypothetical protein Kpho01_04630 [Kitasatospora phosalacinea]